MTVPPPLAARDLADVDHFAEWLHQQFCPTGPPIDADTSMEAVFGADLLARFVFLNALERHVGERFPVDLVAACETVGDWHHFAVTKLAHAGPPP